MSAGRTEDLVAVLEALAAYEGPWEPLRKEQAVLQSRIEELHARLGRLEGLLVVALVGGSGVGKSTLLNALAGDELAAASAMRPCTTAPTVYHPPGAQLPDLGWETKPAAVLERIVLIDTPDSDTVIRDHRERVAGVLAQCDLVLLCGSAEKYLDEATWSLLRPLAGQRAVVCVETKAAAETSPIRQDWTERLECAGLAPDAYFRVAALRAYERKLTGQAPGSGEIDFAALEDYLRTRLDAQHIVRIKRANVTGLLRTSLESLRGKLTPWRPKLEAAMTTVDTQANALAEALWQELDRRLFSESHLWVHALWREIAPRSKGILGLTLRLLAGLNSLFSAAASLRRCISPGGLGRAAAETLAGQKNAAKQALAPLAAMHAGAYESAVNLALAEAGFAVKPGGPGENDPLAQSLAAPFEDVLGGSTRDDAVRAARRLTAWPAALLLDAAPVAFLVFAAFKIVQEYASGVYMDPSFFVHTLAVFLILISVGYACVAGVVRLAAGRIRQRARLRLRAALAECPRAFGVQRDWVAEAAAFLESTAPPSGE